MSRLNYMAEEDEALSSLREDLAVLERFQSSGHEFTADQKSQISDLIGRLAQLVSNPDWSSDEEPLPEWLRRKPTELAARKRRAAGS